MSAYNPEYSQKHEAYRRKKYRRVALDYDRQYYDEILKPAADRAGEAVGTYIKEAAAARIQKEGAQGDNQP